MTVINRVWDAALGRYRDHYAWELPPELRGPAREAARDRRRAERDAAARARRTQQGRTR